MKSIHPERGATRIPLALALLVGLGTAAIGQTNEIPSRFEPLEIDTGPVLNHTRQLETVAAFHVSQPGAAWMRLYFSDVELSGSIQVGNGTFLRITSLFDGYYQFLDAKTIEEWQHSSAYFNGDLLLIEVVAYPGTGPSRVALDRVEVGIQPNEDTICGVDNRVASNDPRNSRLMPIGCTSWLIDDACGCFITAGHCIGGSIVQFNVPLSNSNGSTNNPPPQDQYAVDTSSRQSTNGGQGNDWGYFGCFPNSTTGLTPKQTQGSTYTLGLPPAWNSSLNVRITGYGVDGGTANQTQQTHVGPWVTYTGGNLLAYQADTQGGNSGSPVVQEESGIAMGVHTHGGCTSSSTGSNKGTSLSHPNFQNALANPRGVCKKTTPVCGTVPFTSVRNGTGVNPVCLASVSEPALGTRWEYQVDPSLLPGATFSIVRARKPGPTVPSAFGEHLLNEASRVYWTTVASGPGPHVHGFDVPPTPELAGFVGSIQATLFQGHESIQLCNAVDFVIGCVQQ